MGYSGIIPLTFILVLMFLAGALALAVNGLRRKNGALMLAAGSWALSLVGCVYASDMVVNSFSVLVAFPVISAFGVTFFILGLREIFR